MGGQPNPNGTQTVINQTQLPQWYQDVLAGTAASGTPGTPGYKPGQQGLIPEAQSLTSSQYVPYTGQQVAGFTPAQTQSFNAIENAAPWSIDQNILQKGYDTLDQGYQAVQQANNAAQQGIGYDTQAGTVAGGFGNAGMGTYNSGLGAAQQGLGYASQAGQQAYGGAQAAAPYIQAGTTPTGLMAASPFLGGASGNWAQNAQAYMNPYTQNANNALAQQFATNLNEFVLPQISSQFVGLGQSGSPQQANFEANIINQQGQSLLNQQAANLNQAYNTGASTYESDAARQAQLASTAGGLGTAQQQANLQAATGLGGLTQSGVQSLLGAGQTAGQLGLGTGQLGLGAGQLGTQGLLGAGQGIYQGAGQMLAGAGVGGQLATEAGQLASVPMDQAIQYAGALNSIGTQQQQLNQTSLNTGYQNFLNQQQFPYQQLGYLSNIIHGLPVNQSQVYQNTQPLTAAQMQPSILGQLGGAAIGAAGLSGAGSALGGTSQGVNLTYRKGGVVRGSRRNATYGKHTSSGLGFAVAA